jgi:homoserine dehydrogenase
MREMRPLTTASSLGEVFFYCPDACTLEKANMNSQKGWVKMGCNKVKIGLLGFGTVGTNVVQVVHQNQAELLEKCGYQVEVGKILVRDLHKERAVSVHPSLLTLNGYEVVHDPEIQIVIEVMGGVEEARAYILAALQSGKHVITANKDLLALHGHELHEVAESHGCELLYEAAVAGAIPIIRALKQSLACDRIHEVLGIVNGTTNFILTKMSEEGVSFADALAEAQQLGYAEADPHSDVAGLDAARKMAILATIAFSQPVALDDVRVTGITHLTSYDIEQAAEQSAVIKLIGRAKRVGTQVEVSVEPTVLPLTHPLAKVGDCFNAVYVYGEAVGETMFYGRGAGGLPTASAVVGDLLAVLRGCRSSLYKKPYSLV